MTNINVEELNLVQLLDVLETELEDFKALVTAIDAKLQQQPSNIMPGTQNYVLEGKAYKADSVFGKLILVDALPSNAIQLVNN